MASLASIFIVPVQALDDSATQQQASSALETIVVTGRPVSAALREVPASVGVVDSQSLELVQHSHITESADRIAGVWVSRGNGQEHLTAIRSPVFTGPGSCGEFVVLEDGIPTRPAGFCNVNQLFELNSEQADRIEIYRGPASSVYGSNAIHGVINIISPDITDREQTTAMLDGGPHDYARAFVNYSDGKNIRINAHGDHDGGYSDDSGFDQQKVNVKYLDRRDNTTVESFVEMTNLNQETAGYIQGVDAYKDDDLKKTNANPEAFRDAKSLHGYQRYTFKHGDNKEIEITPYANASEMEFLQHFVPSAPLEKNGHDSVGVNGRFSYPLLGLPADRASVNSGFNLETARAYVDEFQSAPTMAGGYVQGQHYDFDVRMNSLALSSELSYLLHSQVRAVAGLRYDHQFYNYDTKTAADTVGRYTRLADRDDEFGNWGANLGLLYDWSDNHQFYVSAASGFRAPQVAELYRLEGGVPAHAVESEKVDSVELGLRGNFLPPLGDTLFYEIAVFDMYKDNVILKGADRQYIGDAETSHEGVELLLDYRFLNNSAYLRTALTYAEHRYEDVNKPLQGSPVPDVDGNIIDTAPRHYGSVQLGKMHSWGLVEVEVKHLGPYYLGPENTQEYEGHDLLNLRAEWIVAADTKIGFRLLNVLDTEYAERADATPFSTDPRYFVGEPRSLYVSIAKTFY